MAGFHLDYPNPSTLNVLPPHSNDIRTSLPCVQHKTEGELSADTYRVEGEVPEDEEWAFAPGTIVRGSYKTFSGGEVGIAAVEIA